MAKGCNCCLRWLINSGCYIRAQNQKTKMTAQVSSWSFVLCLMLYATYLDIHNAINVLQATFGDTLHATDACY